MKFNSMKYKLFAGLLLCAAGILTAQAQSTIVTFSVDMGTNIDNGTLIPGTDTVSVRGSFNGWGAVVLNLVQAGGGTVYTNTVNDTTDANGAVMTYKFFNDHPAAPNGGYESLSDGNNRAVVLPSVSGSSLVLPTPFFSDSGAPSVINSVTFRVDMTEQII